MSIPSTATQGISILVEPIDVTTQEGSYVNLSAVIKAQRPTYQWYNQDGKPIENKCENNLLIGPITRKEFGFYRLSILDEFTNQRVLTRWVEIKSATEEIKYNKKQNIQNIQTYTDNKKAPKLIVQPKGGIFRKGDSIDLIAHFENAVYYQWYKDGEKLEGCTGNTLLITNALTANTGTYVLLASNEYNIIKQTQIGVVIN